LYALYYTHSYVYVCIGGEVYVRYKVHTCSYIYTYIYSQAKSLPTESASIK